MSVSLSLKRLVLVTILIFQVTIINFAQKPGKQHNWEVGISVGASKFLNSINPNSDAQYKKFNYWNSNLNSSFSLFLIRNISSQFSAEFEWQTSKLSGTWNQNSGYAVPKSAIDLGLPYPNPFKTGINEFDLMLCANLNKVFFKKIKNERWYIFIKGGGGAVLIKEFQALYPYATSGNPFKYSIAYGAGFSYKIDDKVKLKLGLTFRQVETDRLDGIHTMRPVPPFDAIYNVKEVYSSTFLAVTYTLSGTKGKIFGRNNKYFPWFRPASKKYKGHK